MIIRGQFSDFFFETALPAINSVSMNDFKMAPRLMEKLFNVESSNRSIEQFSQMSGVGLATEIVEGDEPRLDFPVQGFDITFKHKRYGLGVEFSRDMFEDDKFGIVTRSSKELGLSINETIEIQAASVFNNAFNGSFVGGDGVSLCSSSHPLIKAGGTQSNILSVAADLDQDSLQLALTDWELMKRSNGQQISLPVPSLLVTPQNRWTAFEITKAGMRSDTANNTPNVLKYAEGGAVDQVIVWKKLTDPDAWFLVAPSAPSYGPTWFWRVKPYTKGFADDRTERGGTAIRYKASYGFTDYYGVYGTPGA